MTISLLLLVNSSVILLPKINHSSQGSTPSLMDLNVSAKKKNMPYILVKNCTYQVCMIQHSNYFLSNTNIYKRVFVLNSFSPREGEVSYLNQIQSLYRDLSPLPTAFPLDFALSDIMHLIHVVSFPSLLVHCLHL